MRRRKAKPRRRKLSRALVRATYKRNLTRLARRARTRQERVDACNAIVAHHSTRDISTATMRRLLAAARRSR